MSYLFLKTGKIAIKMREKLAQKGQTPGMNGNKDP
jgi:hypothetical protein